MNLKEETRSGSKWRRSLMALAILSAPVVSIAGFSGSASAGNNDPVLSVVSSCSAGVGSITATLTNAGGNSYYWTASIGGIEVQTGTYQQGENPGTTSIIFTRSNITPVSSSAYNVVLTRYTRTGAGNQNNPYVYNFYDSWPDTELIDCRFESTDVFTVSPECGEDKGIRITLESKYNDRAPYKVVATTPNGIMEVEFTNIIFDVGVGNPKVYTGSVTFLEGLGSYTLIGVVHKQSLNPLKVKNTEQTVESYSLTCQAPPPTTNPGGGYNFTFNLPKVTTPALPSTGSDSSTSLLVIAPVMMLLGAGLIMARRRTSTV